MQKQNQRQKVLRELKKESKREMDEHIKRCLALPYEARMNFLRRRLPGGGSSL